MTTATLSRALAADDAPPCDGCKHQRVCAAGAVCERFREWTACGKVRRGLSGVPMAHWYRRLFPEDAVAAE